jgi:SAM-dependent methyltransferase
MNIWRTSGLPRAYLDSIVSLLSGNNSEAARIQAVAQKLNITPSQAFAKAKLINVKFYQLASMLEVAHLLRRSPASFSANDIANLSALILQATASPVENITQEVDNPAATIDNVRTSAMIFFNLKADTNSLSTEEKDILLGIIFKRAVTNPNNLKSTTSFFDYMVSLQRNTVEWNKLVSAARAKHLENTLSPELRFLFESNQLSLATLSAESFRDLFADTSAIGPNSSMLSLANWVNTHHPDWLKNANGTATLLGREVAQILSGGVKAAIPKSLQERAEQRKWIRFNRNQIATGMSSSLTGALTNLPAPRTVLELGAGNGHTCEGILKKYPQAIVTAIDGDSAALDRLNERLGSNQARLSTMVGNVLDVPFPMGQDLIIAERLLPHLNDQDATTLLAKIAAALNAEGVLVVDFYTTMHLLAKSGGAVYRDIESIRNLVQRDFTIVSETDSGGLVTYVLKPKKPTTAKSSQINYENAKKRLLSDSSLSYGVRQELEAILKAAEANGNPLSAQTLATLLDVVRASARNSSSFFATRQALYAVSLDRSLTSQQAIEIVRANESMKVALERRYPRDVSGLSVLWTSRNFLGVLTESDAKVIVRLIGKVVEMLQRSYPAPAKAGDDIYFPDLLARDAIWKSVRDLLSGTRSLQEKEKALLEVGQFQSQVAIRFKSSAFASDMGNTPTSFVNGGHATIGLFAGIKGNSVSDIVKNIDARADSLVASGRLQLIAGGVLGGGSSNRAFLDTVTGEIVRVGHVSSIELAETFSLPKISPQIGALVSAPESLYTPMATQVGKSVTYGYSVQVMVNVGKPWRTEFDSLSATKKTVAIDSLFDALVQLHMSGRYHTDLHLQNVTIDRKSGRVVLIDFGRMERSNFGAVTAGNSERVVNPAKPNFVNEKDNYPLSHGLEDYGVSEVEFRQKYLAALDKLESPPGRAASEVFNSRRRELRRSMESGNWQRP